MSGTSVFPLQRRLVLPLPLLLFSPTISYLTPVRTPRSRPSSVVLSAVADIAADTAGVAAMD